MFGLDQALLRKPSLQPSGSGRSTAATALAGWEALREEREFCRDVLCYLVGFRQWREGTGRQTNLGTVLKDFLKRRFSYTTKV